MWAETTTSLAELSFLPVAEIRGLIHDAWRRYLDPSSTKFSPPRGHSNKRVHAGRDLTTTNGGDSPCPPLTLQTKLRLPLSKRQRGESSFYASFERSFTCQPIPCLQIAALVIAACQRVFRYPSRAAASPDPQTRFESHTERSIKPSKFAEFPPRLQSKTFSRVIDASFSPLSTRPSEYLEVTETSRDPLVPLVTTLPRFATLSTTPSPLVAKLRCRNPAFRCL